MTAKPLAISIIRLDTEVPCTDRFNIQVNAVGSFEIKSSSWLCPKMTDGRSKSIEAARTCSAHTLQLKKFPSERDTQKKVPRSRDSMCRISFTIDLRATLQSAQVPVIDNTGFGCIGRRNDVFCGQGARRI